MKIEGYTITIDNSVYDKLLEDNMIGNINELTIHSKTTLTDLSEDEFILESLKQSGIRLKQLLNITEEDIDRAIKEMRKEG